MSDKLLVHKHLIIRAEALNPPTDTSYLTNWFKEFIQSINMKVLMGPYVIYHNIPGNRGITGAATCPRVDHKVSRLPPLTMRPIQTRFRFGCRSKIFNLASEE